MAERRMFAKTIIDSDAFFDMPVTARLLYYDLGMRADDDGFVNSPKKIIRMINASEDDFKILVAKKFIIPFESGIVVIKHWRINNYLRSDRYNETKYTDEKKLLNIDENGAYKSMVYDCGVPDGIPEVTHRDTQVRLGKVRLLNPIDQIDDGFEQFWNHYPKKVGKAAANKSWTKNKPNIDDVLKALEWQKESDQWNKKDGQFIPNPATYINQKRWLDEPVKERMPF